MGVGGTQTYVIIEQPGITCAHILGAPGMPRQRPTLPTRVQGLPSACPAPHPVWAFLGLHMPSISPYAHQPLTNTPPLQGYSFVAPSILFDRNNAVMTDVLEAPGAGDRPGPAAVARSAMMQVGWARVGSCYWGVWVRGVQTWLHQVPAVCPP